VALESNPSFRVLVVAEVEGRRSFARAVAPLGWEISFETGLDLVAERARSHCIELVVLDWSRSKGREFDEIRRFREKSRVALVVVAVGLSDEDAARVLENGANCVIGEPSQSRLFLARCAAMMRWPRPNVENGPSDT